MVAVTAPGPASAVDEPDLVPSTSTTTSSTSTTTSSSTTTTSVADEDEAGASNEGTSTTTTSTTTSSVPQPTTTTATAPPTSRAPATTATTGPNPLLVAGPPSDRRELAPEPPAGPDGAEADVAPGVDEPASPAQGEDDTERVIRLVVVGLVAVAVLLAGLAVYYWWITRPEPVTEHDDDADDTDPGTDVSDPPGRGDGTVDPWLTDSTSTR